MIDFSEHINEIELICKDLKIKRLGYFGSVNTLKFHSQNSDIDFLVQFGEMPELDLFTRYFELKEYLEKLFNRPVDLVFDRIFKNPVFREEVEKNRKVLYES